SGRIVHDLFEDLQDGHNLLSLLEVLSGELLARERGRMRFHKVQNCNAGLQFLKYRKIKVVNIRPEDIVDGNPKLTLGLIWTIILHFQAFDPDSPFRMNYLPLGITFGLLLAICYNRLGEIFFPAGIFDPVQPVAEHVMYRFVREKHNPASPSTTSATNQPEHGSTNRSRAQAQAQSQAQADMYRSQPVLSMVRGMESRIQETNRNITRISVNGFDPRDGSRVVEESSDAVTRIFVNESPGFGAAVAYRERDREGLLVRPQSLYDVGAGGREEQEEGGEERKSKHKLVKRRRNITEEETVTVTRRIRRVKGRSLVVIDDEQEVPVERQISVNISGNANQVEQQYQELNAREARNALLVWARDSVKGYPGVACKDFSRSWRDGLAFNALLHRHRPHLIDFRAARQRSNRENLEIAFGIAEKEFGVTRLLDAEDVDTPEPDDKSIITYVSSLYDVLGNTTPQLEEMREARTNAYVDQAVSFHSWMTVTISRLHGKYQSSGVRETQSLLAECAAYRSDDLPRKLDLKNQLSELYYELENLYVNVPSIPVKEDIQPATLDKLWRILLTAIEQRERSLQDDLRRCEKLRPTAETTCRSVLIIDGRLKHLKDQMKQDEQRIRSLKNPYEAKSICDTYDNELREIEVTIKSTMTDARVLREQRYYDCETIYRSVLEVEKKYVSIRTMYREGIIAQVAGKTFTSEETFVTKRTEKISSTRLLDHREQTDDGDGSAGEDEASQYSVSVSSRTKRLSETNGDGGPVVQIQSYVDRENGVISTSVKGRNPPSAPQPDTSRKLTSSLAHARQPDGHLTGQPDADRKRSKSLLNHDTSLDDPAKQHDLYYFGSADPSRNDGKDRPSKELSRAQMESAMAGGDQPDRRNGGATQKDVTHQSGLVMQQQSNGHPTVDSAKVNGQVVDQAALLKKARSDSLKEKANQVLAQLELFVGDLNEQASGISLTVAAVQQAVENQAELQRTISARGTDITSLRKDIDDARTNSKGLTALLNEHRVHMTTTPPPIYAKSSELNSIIMQIASNYDQLCSDATASQQNLQCLVDLLAAYQAHLDEASQWIGLHERQIHEAESLPNDKAGVELAKLRFQELGRQTGEFQHQIDRLAAIYGDIQMRTENKAEQIRENHERVMDRWKKLREACHERMRNLDSVSFFLQSCEQLLAWLTQKHKMISVLGPISYDLALLDHQRQQVDVLLEELRAQRGQINKLHDESGHLLSQTRESERSNLISKLNHVDDLWTELVHALEARRRQIENAAFAGQVFVDSFHTLEAWLGKISGLYEKFIRVDDSFNAERQLEELKNIESELNGQTYLLANAENAAATLCEVLANDVTATEIDAKMQNAKKIYGDLKKRNEALKSGLEKNVKEGKEFDLACSEMSKWFQSINDRMRPNVKVSALLDVLNHQLDAFGDVRDEITRKESEVHTLIVHGKELVSKSPSDISASIQDRLESIQSEWHDVEHRAKDRAGVLQNAQDQATRYKVAVDVFMPILQRSENSVAAFAPVSFRREENSVQLKTAQNVQSEIRVHVSDFDAVQQQGTVLLACCETDTEGIVEEVAEIQTRWQAVEQVTMKRVRSLEDVSHRLTEYADAMASFEATLVKCEEKLAVAEEAEPDQRTMENLVALQDEVESMKRQIDFVEDFGHALLADGAESDVRHIEEELTSARERYDELENKIGESITFLEGATSAVSRFVDYLKQTENCVNELEDEFDNMAPQGKDLDTILDQIDEVGRFEKNIDATVKEVQDAESALEDLVDHHYSNNADGWKDQITGMFEQLENLVIRSQNRASDLDVAREKLEEFQHTLANVMQSLSQDGDDGMELPADGRANYIHEQFSKRLDGMLVALNSTAEKLATCEPISALPGKLQKQMEENTRLIEDLGKRSHAYESAKRAAADLAKLASNEEDGATVDSIQDRLSGMDEMWMKILKDTEDRGRSLEDTFKVSVKFWEELGNVTELIKELETALLNQEPPAVEIPVIKGQQEVLQELKDDLDQSKPNYDHVVSAGHELIDLCGEPDRPEVKKSIEELDHVWGNITQLFLQRDTDLVDAMDKSMSFHGLLQSLTQFLAEAEDAFGNMGSIGADIDTVKEQMEQLKEFRAEMGHTQSMSSHS
ncbi:Dystonin, partial [Hypsibius exemplaris]